VTGRALGSSPALESHPACALLCDVGHDDERDVSRRLEMQVFVTQVQEHREQWLLAVAQLEVVAVLLAMVTELVLQAMVQQVAIGQEAEPAVLEQRAMALLSVAAVD